MPIMLIQVTAPHFCAGLVTDGERITEAAPILRWALRKRWPDTVLYFRKKGWKLEWVDENDRQDGSR